MVFMSSFSINFLGRFSFMSSPTPAISILTYNDICYYLNVSCICICGIKISFTNACDSNMLAETFCGLSFELVTYVIIQN